MPGYTYVPEGLAIPLDEAKIKSGDPDQLWEALNDFYISLKEHLDFMAGVVNLNPEYCEGTSTQEPANGKFSVWKDTSVTPPKYRLVYGDAGAKLVEGAVDASETVKGIVERATDEEAQEGTDTERYITPKQLVDAINSVEMSYSQYMRFQHNESAGTGGGTATSGSWNTRKINTEVLDIPNIASLSSNQITLPAGTYYIRALSSYYYCSYVKTRLYNVTDSAELLRSIYSVAPATSHIEAKSHIDGYFTLTGSKALELQYRCSVTYANNGLGYPYNIGGDEIYAVIEIWKVA